MDRLVAVVRVPHQASTKWLILLAALVAAAISWWQHRDDFERLSRASAARAPASRDATSRTTTRPASEETERVEFEVELVTE